MEKFQNAPWSPWGVREEASQSGMCMSIGGKQRKLFPSPISNMLSYTQDASEEQAQGGQYNTE